MTVFNSLEEAKQNITREILRKILMALPTGELFLLTDRNGSPHSCWDSQWDAETVSEMLDLDEYEIRKIRFAYLDLGSEPPMIFFLDTMPDSARNLDRMKANSPTQASTTKRKSSSPRNARCRTLIAIRVGRVNLETRAEAISRPLGLQQNKFAS